MEAVYVFLLLQFIANHTTGSERKKYMLRVYRN